MAGTGLLFRHDLNLGVKTHRKLRGTNCQYGTNHYAANAY